MGKLFSAFHCCVDWFVQICKGLLGKIGFCILSFSQDKRWNHPCFHVTSWLQTKFVFKGLSWPLNRHEVTPADSWNCSWCTRLIAISNFVSVSKFFLNNKTSFKGPRSCKIPFTNVFNNNLWVYPASDFPQKLEKFILYLFCSLHFSKSVCQTQSSGNQPTVM